MIKLLSFIGGLTLTAASTSMLPLNHVKQTATNQTILNSNFIDNKYNLEKLAELKTTIASFGEFKNEIYIGMVDGTWGKIDSKTNKFVELPSKWESEDFFARSISSFAEFNNELYFVVGEKLVKMSENGKDITILLELGPYAEVNYLKVFNNELYFSSLKLGQLNLLMKIDIAGTITKVTEFDFDVYISDMNVFNNDLYIFLTSGKIIELNSQKELTDLEGGMELISFKTVTFKDELYLAIGESNGGVFAKINQNDKIEGILPIDNMGDICVFDDELFFSSGFNIEKYNPTSKKLEHVANDAGDLLYTFKDELYIGKDNYLSKLIIN